LPLEELRALFVNAGTSEPRATFYDVRGDLDGLMAGSFPAPENVAVIRQMFADSIADDGLGMKTKAKGDKILLSYPIAVLAADIL
jgi:hypothetical protein